MWTCTWQATSRGHTEDSSAAHCHVCRSAQPAHLMQGLQGYHSGSLPGGGGGGGSGGGGVQLSPTRIVKTDGSTLKMRGLPFRATPEEIMAFFDGFKVWDLA